MAPLGGEAKGQEAVKEEALPPIETSSETAKVLETMTSTTPPQEPPKVIETTSTDSILNLTQTSPSPLKKEPLKPVESPTLAKEEASKPASETPVAKEEVKPKNELPSDIKLQKFEDKKPEEPKQEVNSATEAPSLKEPAVV